MQTVSEQMHLDSLDGALGFLEGNLSRARAAPGTAVPACPGWTVADLYGHLGTVHRWISAILELAGTGQRPGPRSDGLRPPEADPFDFFAASAREMFRKLGAADPATPSWTFGPPPRTVGFWLRRQNLEHLIHAEDLAQAFRLPAPELSAQMALDGADEVLGMLVPQRIRAGSVPAPAPALAFQSAGRRWSIGDGEPVAELSSEPVPLFHGLWRRSRLLDSATVAGPVRGFTEFLATDYVP